MLLDLQGPVFSHEPPHKVEFSNSTGGHIECSGHGSPEPEVIIKRVEARKSWSSFFRLLILF